MAQSLEVGLDAPRVLMLELPSARPPMRCCAPRQVRPTREGGAGGAVAATNAVWQHGSRAAPAQTAFNAFLGAGCHCAGWQ